MGRFEDLTGKIFGELTVVERAPDYILPSGKHQTMWRCKCSCGKVVVTRAISLKIGDSRSCGHLQKEIVRNFNINKKRLNQYDLSGEYGIGKDRFGNEFYFDLDDYELIKDIYWRANHDGYFYGKPSKYDNRKIMMHRLIMGVALRSWKEVQVDHIGGSSSVHDNRKANLRLVTISQNGMNKRLQKNNSSGVAGVGLNRNKTKWRARIKVDNKEISLGEYEEFADAVKARKEAEKKYFGEFAYSYSQKKMEE